MTLRWLVTAVLSAPLLLSAGCHSQKMPTVFYINSYHEGYASSDDVTAAIRETLAKSRIHLVTFFMDTKREPESALERAREAIAMIRQTEPAVIIASDDNAVKHVVAADFKDGPVPCVFCGVNWTCDQYGLPTDFVTGMLEVLPVREVVETLRQYYPDARRLVVLSENTTSELKNKEVLIPIFGKMGLSTDYCMVDTFEQWKQQFLLANRTADLIFLPTYGAIKGWDAADARAFVAEHIRVPVFTCDDFMMDYAVFGRTKVAQEQGRWAAMTALQILKGTSPREIPVTRNRETRIYLNRGLAARIDFHPDASLIDRCWQIR